MKNQVNLDEIKVEVPDTSTDQIVKIDFDSLEWKTEPEFLTDHHSFEHPEAGKTSQTETDCSNPDQVSSAGLSDDVKFEASEDVEENLLIQEPGYSVEPVKVAFEVIKQEAEDEGGEDHDRATGKGQKSSRRSFECGICGKILGSSSSLKRHMGIHNPTYPFKCNICLKKFRFKDKWMDHQRRNFCKRPLKLDSKRRVREPNQAKVEYVSVAEIVKKVKQEENPNPALKDPFECRGCPATFNSKQDQLDHQSTHKTEGENGEICWKCGICDKQFSQLRNLRKHKDTHVQGPCTCEICGKVCKSLGSLKQHMKSLHHAALECPVCSKKFDWKKDLEKHLVRHSDEKPFECQVCSAKFRKNGQLVVHNRVHTGEKPHECRCCGKKFRVGNSLRKHMRTHTGEKPYGCKFCDAKFRTKDGLDKHTRNHTGEKPYGCQICAISFKAKDMLTRHNRRHTGEKPPKRNRKEDLKTDDDEKPFLCQICAKQFWTARALNQHELRHGGEKPFECQVCNKKYHAKQELSSHLLVHKDTKPFECHFCDMKFRRKTDLVYHSRKHTGDTPYKCEFCGKKFGHSSALVNHRKTHTGERPFECQICNKKFSRKHKVTEHSKIHRKGSDQGIHEKVDSV